jgi:ABC-type nitrate/sulfonate/bicarbonate transport system substrate-binding protein
MQSRKKVRVFYRAPGHVPLWKLMQECGFLARHGVEMEFGSLEDKRKRATEGLLSGELDMVSGNHHSLYARRALHNEPFVHIAQADTQWNQRYLVANNGINGLADLKGKRICIDKLSGHPGLNVWLYLEQNGLHDGKNVQLVEGDKRDMERVRHVMAGVFDATFINTIGQMRAKELGARVIELPTMPMIGGVTFTTTTRYVNSHPEEISGLLHAMVDALHYFKTQKKGTIDVINKTCRDVLKLRSDEELDVFYERHAETYQRKPYPTSEAIQNVFALGKKETPELASAGFNPFIMWDLHHLRAIDDSGYIDKLYQ